MIKIKGKSNTYAFSLGRDLKGKNSFLKTIRSVGPWSIQRENPHRLNIKKEGRIIHNLKIGFISAFTLTPNGKTLITSSRSARR